MHCDISVGNILLNRLTDGSDAAGLLIDFEFAGATTNKDDDTPAMHGFLTVSPSINNSEVISDN